MLTQKYRPTHYDDIIGNKINTNAIVSWISSWTSNNKKKMLIVWGPCGVGKSLAIDLILRLNDYNIVELNTDDERGKDYVKSKIKPILKIIKSVSNKKNVLVVEDIDCSSDYGFISSLVDCTKETEIPIICTCNDLYVQSLKPLRDLSTEIKFQKIEASELVFKYLRNIIKRENIKINDSSLRSLFNGDLRNTLNNLQAFVFSSSSSSWKDDNTSASLFDLTSSMLSQTNDMERKYNSFWSDTDLLPLMVHENYVQNSINTTSYDSAIDSLSDMDLFFDSYDLLPYAATSCVQAVINCHPKGGIMKFPAFLGKMSTKNKNNSIYQQFSLKTNISGGVLRLDYVTYLTMILIGPLLLLKGEKREKKREKENVNTFVQKIKETAFPYQEIVLLDSEYNYKSVDSKMKTAVTKSLK
jgi:DNA polymerase III delta prime subunit